MTSLTEIIGSYKNMIIGSRKGIEDVIVSMIPQIVLIGCGLIISILVARGLGPAGVGYYALILSIPTLVTGLSDAGIGQTAIRYASKTAHQNNFEGMHAILRWAFNLRILLVLGISLLFYLISPFLAGNAWHNPNLTDLLRISLLIAIFGVISHIPTIYFQSLKRFKTNTIISTIQTLLTLAGILLIAWWNAWSLEIVLGISIITSAINAVLFILSVPKDIYFKFSTIKGKSITDVLKNSLKAPKIENMGEEVEGTGIHSFTFYMFISTLVVMVVAQMDIWLIGYFLEPSQVGIYNIAKNFTLPLVVVLGAVNTALWPRASALISREKIFELLKTTFLFSIFIAAIGLIYSIIAPLLTPWLFGPAYASGIILGQVLCIRYCISILVCPLGVIGYSFGMVKVYWWINIIQLVTVVIISVWFLPLIGPLASALALIANEIVGFLFVGIIIWRKSGYTG